MGGITETFGDLISSMESKRGGSVRIGTVATNAEDMLFAVHLPLKELSKIVGRAQAYKSLPSKQGAEFLQESSNFVITEVIPRMFREGDADETKWERLKPSTQKWRRANNYQPGPILIASGSLFKEVTDPSRMINEEFDNKKRVNYVSGKLNRVVISSSRLSGKNKVKFMVHNLGGPNAGWNKADGIPPRPFFPMTTSDINKKEQATLSNEFKNIAKSMQRHGEGFKIGAMFKNLLG